MRADLGEPKHSVPPPGSVHPTARRPGGALLRQGLFYSLVPSLSSHPQWRTSSRGGQGAGLAEEKASSRAGLLVACEALGHLGYLPGFRSTWPRRASEGTKIRTRPLGRCLETQASFSPSHQAVETARRRELATSPGVYVFIQNTHPSPLCFQVLRLPVPSHLSLFSQQLSAAGVQSKGRSGS